MGEASTANKIASLKKYVAEMQKMIESKKSTELAHKVKDAAYAIVSRAVDDDDYSRSSSDVSSDASSDEECDEECDDDNDDCDDAPVLRRAPMRSAPVRSRAVRRSSFSNERMKEEAA